jgi:perosamine synthetase
MKRIGNQEREYTEEVLRSEFRTSQLTNMTTRFERAFSKRFGMAFAISHINGTATMHSALAAAGIGPDDEVIVPPLTMASTTLVALYQSAIPVFVDVHPDTFTINPEKIEEALSPRTKAIIPVAVYGLPPDLDPIMDIAKKHNLTVIEDDAECYLGYYKGRVAGSIGHMASFSLQASKHLTAGEGGVVLTNDEVLADRVRAFSILGYDIVRAKEGKITKDVLQSPDYARHTSFGFKYKMPDLCAAVALGQLERLEELVKARKQCAETVSAVIQNCSWLKPQAVPPGFEHSYYTFAMRLLTNRVDFTWHDFRKKFMALGGDGFYAAWLPTYREPMWKTDDFRVRNVVDKNGSYESFLAFYRDKCPVTEEIQPQIIQMKTNYLDDERRNRQADILHRTITYFER